MATNEKRKLRKRENGDRMCERKPGRHAINKPNGLKHTKRTAIRPGQQKRKNETRKLHEIVIRSPLTLASTLLKSSIQ